MKRMLLAVIVLASASGAAAGTPDRLRPGLSSTPDMTRFAIGRACLGVIAEGQSLEAAVGKSGFPWKPTPGAFALFGRTPNEVRIDARGQCYFRLKDGDGAALRLEVLGALADAGYRTEPQFDSGPDGRSGGKRYRQETHCARTDAPDARPLMVLISSSPDRGMTPLQVSLWRDRDGKCPA